MTKQELLTKMAIECSTWDDAGSMLVHYQCITENGFTIYNGLSKQEWLAERERFLNKPTWDNSSIESRYLAMDRDGWWFFYEEIPNRGENDWLFGSISEWGADGAIAIPAGYDWRDSLEERPA